MKVSAVGFLFQDGVKNKKQRSQNYTCVIHKINQDGNYNRSVITSPVVKESTASSITPEDAQTDFLQALHTITDKNSPSKFVGATIKDGIKETEIHSLLSDKIYAVRTKDENGRNHFRLLGKNKTQKVLSKNLYLNA